MDSSSKPDPTIPMPSGFIAAGQSPPPSTPPQVKLNMASTLAMVAAAAASHNGGEPLMNNGGAATTPAGGAGGAVAAPPPKKGAVRYRECLKNHAAGIGGHALDGCGEFMPNKEDDTCMRCAACDCHRNFHRREVEGEKPPPLCEICRSGRRGGSGAVAALTGSGGGDDTPGSGAAGSSLKKRFRTKFSGEQKERMYMLSEKLGWRIQKHDEAEVAQFCADTGVKRHVLKVWMHNNKHTFGNKKAAVSSPSSTSHHHHHHQHDPT